MTYLSTLGAYWNEYGTSKISEIQETVSSFVELTQFPLIAIFHGQYNREIELRQSPTQWLSIFGLMIAHSELQFCDF